MKKRYIVLVGIFITLLLVVYFVVPVKITRMVTSYDPFNFPEILDYDSMRLDYGIGDKSSPADYGFENTFEVNVKSMYDGIKLNGWFVPSSKTRRCLVLVHGRTSNRLKTMKYLELFDQLKIDTSYNFLIPDLRNSGKSENSETMMGYKFAEDLASYLLFVHKQEKQDTFLLYGFSMGAMAIMIMNERSDLNDSLRNNNIFIDKLIFDSPLSNVKETLRKNSAEMGLPGILFEKTFDNFNEKTDFYGDKMRLSYLWNQNPKPTLILTSKTDKTTLYSIFDNEFNQLEPKHIIELELFDSVDHVKIYQDPRYKERYSQIVADFIGEP